VYTIDIDTGGTFTDGYVCGDGREVSIKVDTTPHDLTTCFYSCIEEGAKRLGIPMPTLLDQTRVIRFSSTIATNTAVQLNGPKLGVIVTSGAEVTLYSDKGSNPLQAFVSPKLVMGIDEGVDSAGDLVRPPNEEDVDEKVRFLLENGSRMLVISLRNAHLNPANELTVRRFINAAYPRHYLGAVPLLVSHQVSRVPSDEIRTNTAIINGYFHRSLVNSLYKAEDLVRAQQYRHPLMIVTADYGVTRVAKTRAINTYQSGPASGVRGAHVLAEKLGHRRVLSIDVGGTTSDVAFIADGSSNRAKYRPINGVQVAQRVPDIVSFGLGGGSKIRLAGNEVRVGPDSQGAVPGPACFGLGGRIPTPTDIWLLLGYLAPDRYLGGRKNLDARKAREVVHRALAEPLKISDEDAALKAKEAVESELANHVLQSGPIPDAAALHGATLYAIGGGAGLLAVGLARKLKMGQVYVPLNAAVFCAFGASTLDVSHAYEEILPIGKNAAAGGNVKRVLAKLVQSASRDMRGEGYSDEKIGYAVDVECLSGVDEIGRASGRLGNGALGREVAAFIKKPPAGGQYLVIRLTATCLTPHPAIKAGGQRARGLAGAAAGRRRIRLARSEVDAPVYAFDKLPIGAKVQGPAIVENEHTSVLVPDEVTLVIDKTGGGVMGVKP
jgi:N-methylhydantoinase A/acetophenone carboxylase